MGEFSITLRGEIRDIYEITFWAIGQNESPMTKNLKLLTQTNYSEYPLDYHLYHCGEHLNYRQLTAFIL